ncbi:transcriptional regulator [Eoetvoesiella caeni]
MPQLDEKQAFTARLKQALKRSPKKVATATELALQFNLRYKGEAVSQQAAQKWLTGKSRPAPDKIETLANWLNVPVQWLRYGIGEKTLPPATEMRAREPSPGFEPLTEEEIALVQRIRGLSAHRKYLITEIVEQFALDREIWRP